MTKKVEKVLKIYADNRCKELRMHKKLTQVDISKVIGTSDWIITQFETTGKINPKYLEPIADALGVEVDFLIGESKVSVINPTDKMIARLNDRLIDIEREIYRLKTQNDVIQRSFTKLLLNKEENEKTSLWRKIFRKV